MAANTPNIKRDRNTVEPKVVNVRLKENIDWDLDVKFPSLFC